MRGPMNVLLRSALAALFVFCAGIAIAQVSFGRGDLVITTTGGLKHKFSVELALTADQRSQGLMFRKEMPLDHGMLFDFGQARPVAMWMQNTPLPLDMLFIQDNGTISHIHENAVPFSQAIIDSHGAVKYVLELNAGRAKALGLQKGDRVISAQIGNVE